MIDVGARTRNIIAGLLIISAVALSMGRLVGADFTNWDDNQTISENPALAPPTFASLARFWSKPTADLYVPVTYSLWWILARISYATDASGTIVQNPHVFHIANVALHAMTSLIVFALVKRLFSRIADDPRRLHWAATAAALLFAVHPVQVETVGWTSGTKDLLSGLFCAIAIWHYIAYAQLAGRSTRREMPADVHRAVARHYILAFTAFIFAILSKPSAVALPLMALALDVFIFRRGMKAIARGLVPMFVISLAAVIIARAVQEVFGVTNLVPWYQRILVALDAINFYLRKLVLPGNLAFDYGRNPRAVIESGAYQFTWIMPVVVTALLGFGGRKFRVVVAGAAMFISALLPVLGLTAFDFQEYSTVADHYLYFPMIGLAIAVSAILIHVHGRWAWAFTVSAVGAVVVLFTLRSADQSKYWMNSIALMRNAIEVNPKSWVSYTNLGNALAANDQISEALDNEYKALALRPDNPDAHMNIGAIKLEQGDLADATKHFEAAVRLRRSTQAHTNLANAYGQAARFDDAIDQLRKALEMDPQNRKARRMLDLTIAHVRSQRSQPATRSTQPSSLQEVNFRRD
jgi:cytochrome c-type biogenesis protein CcmH/NrfG